MHKIEWMGILLAAAVVITAGGFVIFSPAESYTAEECEKLAQDFHLEAAKKLIPGEEQHIFSWAYVGAYMAASPLCYYNGGSKTARSDERYLYDLYAEEKRESYLTMKNPDGTEYLISGDYEDFRKLEVALMGLQNAGPEKVIRERNQ